MSHNIEVNIQDIQRRLDYLNRLYSFDKTQEINCEIENKEFVPSSKYYKDLSFLCDSQGPFKCSHCNEIILKFEKYHVHVSEHTNVVPFKCALCEVRFKKLSKYIVHAKRHLGLHKYHCDDCGKGYQFKSELEWHIRLHTGVGIYYNVLKSYKTRDMHLNFRRSLTCVRCVGPVFVHKIVMIIIFGDTRNASVMNVIFVSTDSIIHTN